MAIFPGLPPKEDLLYLHLYHGRKDKAQDMEEGRGTNGPLLGPFTRIHITYADEIRCFLPEGSEAVEEAPAVSDEFLLGIDRKHRVLYYDGVWYGDYSIHPACAALKSEYLTKNIQVPLGTLSNHPKE